MIATFTLVIQQTATFMMLTHLIANVALENYLIATSAPYIELFDYSFCLVNSRDCDLPS